MVEIRLAGDIPVTPYPADAEIDKVPAEFGRDRRRAHGSGGPGTLFQIGFWRWATPMCNESLSRRVIYMASLLSIVMALVGSSSARAEADGPDFWSVRGVRNDDVLNMRAAPSPTGPLVTAIPHDARGLRNLGCQGGPTFAQWNKMTPAERNRASRKRWCKVEYAGRQGWVAGRYLSE